MLTALTKWVITKLCRKIKLLHMFTTKKTTEKWVQELLVFLKIATKLIITIGIIYYF